jgi:cytochrome bd-type quinol oxidase subunit 2
MPEPLARFIALAAALCAGAVPALAAAQADARSAQPGASSFTWFVVLAAIALIAVLFFALTSRRRRRVPVEPPRP